MKRTYAGTLRVEPRGCIVVNRYSGARKGRSYSSADTTYITLPSPSSNDAMFTKGAAATSRDHFVNQSARLCVIPTILVV